MKKDAQKAQAEYRFKDRDELLARYPEFKSELSKGDLEQPVTLEVTGRTIHIVDTAKQVKLSYSRDVDEKEIVSNYAAKSGEELVKTNPQWEVDYQKYGTGISQKVMAISKWLGDLFLRLLKMVTIPLIVTSLVTGIASLGNATQFGKMFSRTILYYLSTSFLAIFTGIFVVNLLRPGVGANLPGGTGSLSSGGDTISSIFLEMVDRLVPTNVIHALGEGEFLSIISFSMLTGIFIILVGGKHGKVLTDLFSGRL